jgi:hypothetical protein
VLLLSKLKKEIFAKREREATQHEHHTTTSTITGPNIIIRASSTNG